MVSPFNFDKQSSLESFPKIELIRTIFIQIIFFFKDHTNHLLHTFIIELKMVNNELEKIKMKQINV